MKTSLIRIIGSILGRPILLKEVLDGNINLGRVFTQTYDLDDINQAYQDMQDRKTTKSMVVVSD